jgi:hypothetical protein
MNDVSRIIQILTILAKGYMLPVQHLMEVAMNKIFGMTLGALLLAASLNANAFWGGNNWGGNNWGNNGYNDWPVFTPMYWMEEMSDVVVMVLVTAMALLMAAAMALLMAAATALLMVVVTVYLTVPLFTRHLLHRQRQFSNRSFGYMKKGGESLPFLCLQK